MRTFTPTLPDGSRLADIPLDEQGNVILPSAPTPSLPVPAAALLSFVPNKLTDSSGGTASDTLAAGTNTTALTDSGGGTADATVASMAATTALTDSSGGTANTTVQAIGGSFNQAEIANNFADVTAAINALITWQTTVQNNFKEVTTQLAIQRTLNGVLLDHVASLAAKINSLLGLVQRP